MGRSSIYGAALVAGAAGMVATMIFHPTGHELLAPAEEAARRNEAIAVATHSLALASTPALFFGFLGLSRRLGAERPLVSAALVSYAFGGAAALCAAVASGLVAPTLTRQIQTADPSDEATRQLLHRLFSYNGLLNQGFAKVFVVASSLALVLWSAALLRAGGFARIVGAAGCVVGALSLAAFFSGRLRLDVHGFGLFIFAQSAWVVMAGVFMLRPAVNSGPRDAEPVTATPT